MNILRQLPILIAVAVILLTTLWPGDELHVDGRVRGHDRLLADALLNLVLFFPLGGALGYRGRSARASLLIGILLSGIVELAQTSVPGRESSFRDVFFNALGVAAGWMLWRSSVIWALPDPRFSGRLAISGAIFAGTLLTLTGFLLAPSLPRTTYFGGWAHEFGHLRSFKGSILEATVGDLVVPSGSIPHSLELRSHLLDGSPLKIRGIGGPHVSSLAPLLSIHDQNQREILLVGVDKDDLVFRFRTRAAIIGLDSPELRVREVMRDINPGDSFTITLARRRSGYCIDVNQTSTCGLGFTAAVGWAFLLYSQGVPPWAHSIWNAAWIAGLGFLPGYWTDRAQHCVVAAALLGATIIVLPEMTYLVTSPPAELAALIWGFFIGTAIRRQFIMNRFGHGTPSGAR